MDVADLAARCGGVPRAVVAKAKEYLRLAAAKTSSAASDLAGPAAALLLAARTQDLSLDPRALAKIAGVSARDVAASERKLLHAVKVTTVVRVTPAALCIRFGCEAVADIAVRVHAEYQSVVARLARSSKGRGGVDPDDPAFAAACVYACSKQANMRVDRAQLMDAVCANPKIFDAIVSSIETKCKASLSGAIGTKRKQHTASVGKRSAAVIADAADAAAARKQAKTGLVTPPSSTMQAATPSPTRSPHQSQRKRRLFQLGEVRSPGSAASTRDARSAQRAKATATAEEYAAWRVAALAHMLRKREQDPTTPEVESAGANQLATQLDCQA